MQCWTCRSCWSNVCTHQQDKGPQHSDVSLFLYKNTLSCPPSFQGAGNTRGDCRLAVLPAGVKCMLHLPVIFLPFFFSSTELFFEMASWASFSCYLRASTDGGKSQNQNQISPDAFASFLDFAAMFLALLIEKLYVFGLRFHGSFTLGNISVKGLKAAQESISFGTPHVDGCQLLGRTSGSFHRSIRKLYYQVWSFYGNSIFLWIAEGNHSKTLVWKCCLDREQWCCPCLAHICLEFKRMGPPSNVSWSGGPKDVIALPWPCSITAARKAVGEERTVTWAGSGTGCIP